MNTIVNGLNPGVSVVLVKLNRSVRSPFVGFVNVVDKSFVQHRWWYNIC